LNVSLLTVEVVFDAGLRFVPTCAATVVGVSRRIRHILRYHEFRRAAVGRSGGRAARHGERDRLFLQFRASAPIGGPLTPLAEVFRGCRANALGPKIAHRREQRSVRQIPL